MIEKNYNNQTYPAEFYANIVNGARVDDTSVFKIENGALTQIWPDIIMLSPTLPSISWSRFMHAYVKTTSSEFLEIYMGEYAESAGANGGAAFKLDFNFTNLNSNLPVIFDICVATNNGAAFDTELLVNDVVWVNSFPDNQTWTQNFKPYLSSFVLSVHCYRTRNGITPSHDDFLKVTFSKLKNGNSKKFIWPAPQTIYEAWP